MELYKPNKLLIGRFTKGSEEHALLSSLPLMRKPKTNTCWSVLTIKSENNEGNVSIDSKQEKEVNGHSSKAKINGTNVWGNGNSRVCNDIKSKFENKEELKVEGKVDLNTTNDLKLPVDNSLINEKIINDMKPISAENNGINPTEQDKVDGSTEKVNESEEQEQTTEEVKSKSVPFSWAKLVSKTPNNKQSITISASSIPKVATTSKPSASFKAGYKKAQSIVELFSDVKIFMRCPSFTSRGIINNNLLCYANSTLQALVHCPPFFNLLRMVAPAAKASIQDTPILAALLEFMEEYKNTSLSNHHSYLEPIHPTFIINIVKSIGDKFKTQIGQQEDAHEFFDILLNGLDDEFLSIFKRDNFAMDFNLLQQKDFMIHILRSQHNIEQEDDSDEWVGVGAKNKQFIDRGFKMVNTPITSLFSCIYSSTLKVSGQKPKVSHNSSIYLQLEIEPDHIDSVEDAIKHLLEPEVIEESNNSLNGINVKSTKQISIKTLPPILTLQLKNVNYHPTLGQIKIQKDISYPMELTIPLSSHYNTKMKINNIVKYKLTAAVYHHGNEAIAGHYTCDVRHGEDTWVYCNDELVEKLDPEYVGSSQHTYDGSPYMLFYVRI